MINVNYSCRFLLPYWKMMLLYLSSCFIEYLGSIADGGVDFASNVALETADDVALGHSLGSSSTHVCLGPEVMRQSDEDYALQSSIGLTVAAAVQAVPVGPA